MPGANGGLGIYGGAVDSNNDFWGVTYSAGPLVHVTYDTMQAETIPLPGARERVRLHGRPPRAAAGSAAGTATCTHDPADAS